MTKIQSRSGASLADIYDVQGSIAGIDQLETRELPIVHEMGATVLSERFTTRVFRVTTGLIAQNIEFAVEETSLPETPARLLGLQVFIDGTGAQITRCTVMGTDPTLGQDFPLWVLDSSSNTTESIVMEDAGASNTLQVLIPRSTITLAFPTFVGGKEQQDPMVSSVTLAGLTAGFGAGTVELIALLYLAFPRRDGSVGSKGLPVPSW